MNADYSLPSMLKFADYCGKKGLANPATAQAWKSAAGRIFDDLSPAEQADVRKIDVDTAFRRFTNKNVGKFSPASLAQYRARATSVLTEFVKFADNPSAYKPKTPANKLGKKAEPKGELEKKKSRQREQPYVPKHLTSDSTQPPALAPGPSPVSGLSLAFPLRGDFLAQVVVPRDLSLDEAKRLGAFIATLAQDYKPV